MHAQLSSFGARDWPLLRTRHAKLATDVGVAIFRYRSHGNASEVVSRQLNENESDFVVT